MKKLAAGLSDVNGPCPLLPPPVPVDDKFRAAIKPAVTSLAAAMEAFFKTQQSPGVSLGLVYDQELLWSAGFGLVNASDPHSRTPDGSTLYRIGSISKVFVDLLALQLRDAGKFDLDDPVKRYVPEYQPINPFPAEQDVTFRHLGAHLAGLPRESPCPAAFNLCNLTNEQMWANIRSTVYILPPNLQSVYSNLGFAVLGHALETLAATPYYQLISENIVKPLNLRDTGFNYTDDVFRRMAYGFNASYTDIGWEGPAGQLYSNVADMARLASFFLTADMRPDWDPTSAAGAAARSALLGQTSLRQMMGPQYVDPDGSFAFGLPWEMFQTPSGWLLTKDGQIDQYSTEFALLPTVKVGVIALCTDPIVGCGPFMWKMFNTFLPALFQVLQQFAPPPALPTYAAELVGNYSCPLWPGAANVSVVPAGAGHQLQVFVDQLIITNAQYLPQLDRFVIALPANYSCLWADDGVSGQYIQFTRHPRVTMSVPGLMPEFIWTKA